MSGKRQIFAKRFTRGVLDVCFHKFPKSSTWNKRNKSLSVLGFIKCACFRSWGGHLGSFIFGDTTYIAPILRMYDLEIQNYCAIRRTSISFPSIRPLFVCCATSGRSRSPPLRHSPMPLVLHISSYFH